MNLIIIRTNGNSQSQQQFILGAMGNNYVKLEKRENYSSLLCKHFSEKNIFICEDEDMYSRMNKIIYCMQNIPETKHNDDANDLRIHQNIWDATVTTLNFLKQEATQKNFINRTISLTEDIPDLKQAFDLMAEFLLTALFGKFDQIAFFPQGNNNILSMIFFLIIINSHYLLLLIIILNKSL